MLLKKELKNLQAVLIATVSITFLNTMTLNLLYHFKIFHVKFAHLVIVHLKLSEKYGITSDRFETFSDSYHGLAIEGGSVAVANCASCHGSHNIKPSSDSTSTIYKG